MRGYYHAHHLWLVSTPFFVGSWFSKNVLSISMQVIIRHEQARTFGFMMNNDQQGDVREQQTDGARAAGMPVCNDKHQFVHQNKQLAEHH